MENKTLKELSVEHSYYCSEYNFYSNEASLEYETATDFLAEFKEADIDMNLVFRFDVSPRDDKNLETGRYTAQIFMMKQRKGIFTPISIKHINEEEAQQLVKYLKKHWKYLQKLWEPVSTPLTKLTN